MTRLTLPAAALAAALDAVRFAAGADPELPMLRGVLFDVADDLTLVATDRYRLAVARADAAIDGPPLRLLLPLPFLDDLRPELNGDGEITLDLSATAARVGRHETVPVDADFPDHRRLLAFGDTRSISVDPAVLREASVSARRELDGRPYDVLVLGIDDDGTLRVASEAEWDADAHVAVNRAFLLEAIGGAGQMTLELDGPIKPLAIRLPGDPDRFSLLMPVRR